MNGELPPRVLLDLFEDFLSSQMDDPWIRKVPSLQVQHKKKDRRSATRF